MSEASPEAQDAHAGTAAKLESDPPAAGAAREARPSEARGPELGAPLPGSGRDALREALGLAAICCLVGSLPAALRVARAGGSFVLGLLAAAAIVLPLVALAIALGKAAGRGFRLVMGLSAGRSTATGIALFIGLLSPVLVLLGAILKEKTNHRGLGGGTFGVMALVIAGLAALFADRIVESGRWLVNKGFSPRAVATAIALVSVAPMLFVSLPLLSAQSGTTPENRVAAALIDGVIFTLASAVAVTFDLKERARTFTRRVGAGGAGGLFAAGLLVLSLSPSLGTAMGEAGGLSSAMLGGLERWTDRDRDGSGSHFGGRDCDEGDPGIHPGAFDLPGDGVDQDCDGADGVGGGPPALAEPAQDRPADELPAKTVDNVRASLPTQKPHIVWVTLDTVRADHTSLHGYGKPTTPKLLELAARGATFELGYAPASDTQRAYVPLFSGMPFESTPKDRRAWPTLKDEVETVAERMRKAGYFTIGVSSFQWLSRERGFDQGFDQFAEVFQDEHPERGVTGPRAVRAARAAIEKAPADKPVFVWVQLFDAHEQYRRHDGFDFGRGEIGAYDSEIGFTDKQLGDLMAAVEAKLGANVAWAVHGSQGEGFDEHDSKGHGTELYEESVRVPLVIALPSQPALKVAGVAVSTSELGRTVLDLAGASQEGLVGRSLLGAARGGALAPEPLVLAGSKRRAVIDPPLKLIARERKGKERLLLFDLSEDPKEQKDLSEARPKDLARLKALLDEKGPRPAP